MNECSTDSSQMLLIQGSAPLDTAYCWTEVPIFAVSGNW